MITNVRYNAEGHLEYKVTGRDCAMMELAMTTDLAARIGSMDALKLGMIVLTVNQQKLIAELLRSHGEALVEELVKDQDDYESDDVRETPAGDDRVGG